VTAAPAIDLGAEVVCASARFAAILNRIEQLYELAAEVRTDQPGTAETLAASAETQAGEALHLILQWP